MTQTGPTVPDPGRGIVRNDVATDLQCFLAGSL